MKIYLAPIRGITDYIFRDAFATHFGGINSSVTPFISSVQSRKIKDSYLRDILPENNKNIHVIPQVLSKDPDDFLFLAKQIFELGYEEINWNLGCPSPMIANKKRGSGLLPYPELIKSILDKICSKYPGQISIKTRLGRTNPEELDVLMPIFNNYPLKMIIVHPRLGKQMYKGEADHSAFAKCIDKCNHRLIYNGDIFDLELFNAINKKFTVIDDWMIGRGLLKNPYLGRMIKEEPFTVSSEKLLEFHDELFRRYEEILAGPSHLVGRMKGFWCYYVNIFKNEKKCLKRIAKAKGVDHYLNAVKSNFDKEELKLL